jgi:hypothetical protein
MRMELRQPSQPMDCGVAKDWKGAVTAVML